tara:strand:+ start:556 stop:765 length:210 start_codon:yes stop_codon:yes gene_type:complete
MNKKQLEKTILEITAIRDNVRDNLYDIESYLETAQSEIDAGMESKSMAEDSMDDLDNILETLKEELANE